MLNVCQYLAVVNSTKSTKRRVVFLLLVTLATGLSLRAIKCCSVVFGVTLRLLVINIYSSSPAINIAALLLSISVTTCGTVVRRRRGTRVDNTLPVAALTARSEVRYRLRIAISAYPTCIRRRLRGVPVVI